MKTQKLRLSSLKVESFATSNQKETLKGGSLSAASAIACPSSIITITVVSR